MSSNDPVLLYYAEIGRQIAEQQAAEAAAQPPPMDARTAQANRNHQILAARARREQVRSIEAARARLEQDQKAREKQREKENQERAELLDTQMRREIVEEWSAANLPLSSLDTSTMARLLKEKQLERVTAYQAKLRAGPAANAF